MLNESITHSIFAGGGIVTGSTIRSSVLFPESRTYTDSQIGESVLLPNVQVGRGTRLSRVVVDRGCRLPPGLVVGEDAADDTARFERTASGASFMKAGLYFAHALTTVRPTYAREIQTPAGGMGFDGLLATRAADLSGILNGVDPNLWNPATDTQRFKPRPGRAWRANRRSGPRFPQH